MTITDLSIPALRASLRRGTSPAHRPYHRRLAGGRAVALTVGVTDDPVGPGIVAVAS